MTDSPQHPETAPASNTSGFPPGREPAPEAPQAPPAFQVPYAPPAPQVPHAPHASQAPVPAQGRNALGIAAACIAALGFILSCIPGAFSAGWVLLPIGFILGIVSLFMRGQGRAFGIAAIATSVVGALVGLVVFFAVVASIFDEAVGSGGTSVVTPAPPVERDSQSPPEREEGPAEGSRKRPFPIGTTFANDEWEVTVNSVDLDGADAVADTNLLGDQAPAGSRYVIVDVTATYLGSDERGVHPDIQVSYVNPDGSSIMSWDSFVLTPEPFYSAGELYPGASATGEFSFIIPAATVADGVIAVEPGILAEKAFYAVE